MLGLLRFGSGFGGGGLFACLPFLFGGGLCGLRPVLPGFCRGLLELFGHHRGLELAAADAHHAGDGNLFGGGVGGGLLLRLFGRLLPGFFLSRCGLGFFRFGWRGGLAFFALFRGGGLLPGAGLFARLGRGGPFFGGLFGGGLLRGRGLLPHVLEGGGDGGADGDVLGAGVLDIGVAVVRDVLGGGGADARQLRGNAFGGLLGGRGGRCRGRPGLGGGLRLGGGLVRLALDLAQHDAVFLHPRLDALAHLALGDAVQHLGIRGGRLGSEVTILGGEVAEILRDFPHGREGIVEPLQRAGECTV